ncbi:hypothetical protein SHL_00003 [Pseudomonas phage shl2]|uniref:Uncharacterized protein n=1 Tax=Pseudomonas phage shl2 TaxID=1729933 RepID=A0A160SWX9_9CAUD|nr:hypothetical protein HOV57_gp03 [Pseudomonas phage shl2]UAV89379.1 hypothetical protein FMS_25 [Pseudomonas phage FMS]CUR50693.1 hypothetical protein SHL_00003 [Pseudomonas phage shl2]
MNNSEVRAHLRKGETAVALLETLGYRFDTDPANANRKVWIAPAPKPEDDLTASIKKLIKDETAKAYLAGERSVTNSSHGPNWHLVRDMVGKNFKVRPENIPEQHPLRNFSAGPHFFGKVFRAESIQYERSATYTGYTVSFHFNTRPYTPQVVRLPLSCAAFVQ